eukprot:939695-Rhodomonas_salina.2
MEVGAGGVALSSAAVCTSREDVFRDDSFSESQDDEMTFDSEVYARKHCKRDLEKMKEIQEKQRLAVEEKEKKEKEELEKKEERLLCISKEELVKKQIEFE